MILLNANVSHAYTAFRGLGWMLLLLIDVPCVQSQPEDSSTFQNWRIDSPHLMRRHLMRANDP